MLVNIFAFSHFISFIVALGYVAPFIQLFYVFEIGFTLLIFTFALLVYNFDRIG